MIKIFASIINIIVMGTYPNRSSLFINFLNKLAHPTINAYFIPYAPSKSSQLRTST